MEQEPKERRLRLHDVHVPLPYPEHVAGFARLWHELYGEVLGPEEAKGVLYRVLVVMRYKQVTAGQRGPCPAADYLAEEGRGRGSCARETR